MERLLKPESELVNDNFYCLTEIHLINILRVLCINLLQINCVLPNI
jgi:hypothetical protein